MIELHERLFGHRRIDFRKQPLRKALRAGARLVRREGRKLAGKKQGAGRLYRVWGDVLHRASAPGAPPARLTGALQRSIFYKTMDRDGLTMSVGPAARRVFYAHFLAYGTEKMEARPFMETALGRHEGPIRNMLRVALTDSLVPR